MDRQLFPQLPAELRNAIYSYCADDAATSLLTKTFTSAHTTTTICAVHHGNLSLLSLSKYKFLEADEYYSWLMTHGIEVRIAVHFHGHAFTFIQQHWDDKITTHLKKLLKKEAWVAKAAHWDIRVLWDPKTTGAARVKNGRAGEIVRDITSKILSFRDTAVRERHGESRVQLCIPFATARGILLGGKTFGMEQFLGTEGENAKRVCREVVMGLIGEKQKLEKVAPGFVAVPSSKKDEFVARANGSLGWGSVLDGILVMRRIIETDRDWREVGARKEKLHQIEESIWGGLLGECGNLKEAVMVR
jgi:hypothetical protein